MDRLKRIINILKVGCSPGLDGVTAEHLKYMDNSKLLSHILLLVTSTGYVYKRSSGSSH